MSKRRFYEEEPTVKKAVESLFLFPDEIQCIIAKAFSLIAERDCNALELLNEFRTLGSDRVLSLYKSKRKQRKYDNNPTVHKAMNYLLVMDEKSRLFLATKVIELVGFMQDYLKICKGNSITPEIRMVQEISNTYIENGPEVARAFIVRLDEEFKKRLSGLEKSLEKIPAETSKTTASKSMTEGIESQNAGMRIKGDLI